MKTAEEWIELAAIEYSKHGQKNRLDFIRAIQQDAQQDALIKQLGEALGKAHHAIHYQREVSSAEYDGIAAASEAYNQWKRERGE